MSSVVTATVLSNGETVSLKYQLLSLDIFREVNRIPWADIVFIDGEVAAQKFELSDTDLFKPGTEIEIKLKYEDQPQNQKTVFKGYVIRHSIKANQTESLLSLHLKDKVIALTTERKNAIFRDQTDKDIIEAIIGATEVSAKSVEATTTTYPEMVQFNCTDWDFVLSRVDINGHWLMVEDGEVNTLEPKTSGSAAHSFTYGIDEIYDFEFEADICKQYASVDSVAWDITQQDVTTQSAADTSLSQGNLTASNLGPKVGAESFHLTHGGTLEPDELQAWADAKLRKSRLSMFRGQLTIAGRADIKLGDLIELKKIGDRFSGKTLVTAVRHQVGGGDWQTNIQFGLTPEWFAQQSDVLAPPAAGLLPAIQGIQIGVVQPFEEDPQGQFRVKVKIPSLSHTENDDNILWARLSSLDAGNQRGIIFRPEPDDEVVLGFLNNDPRQPVIMGSMFSATNALPEDFEVSEENPKKGIVTKEALKVELDDKNKVIEITTPNSNDIKLSDTDKGILIVDENSNQITLNEQGIQVIDKNGNQQTLDDTGTQIEDANGNKLTLDDTGTQIEDLNGNKLTLNDQGLQIEDSNGNAIKLSSQGLQIEDSNGNQLQLGAQGIEVKASQNASIKGNNIKFEGMMVDVN